MTPTRAVFSVVQYVPDPERAEGANAGIVLYVPSARRITVRTSPTLGRVKKFFASGGADLRRVASSLEALKYRMTLAEAEFAGEDDFARFVAARADDVQLTAPRLVMVTDPAAELDALYAELVGDPDPAPRPARTGRALPPRLAEAFGRLEAAGKLWRPDPITVPTVRRRLPVSAAYQNGATNYVRSESLAAGNWLDKLEKLGFNGRLIAEHPVDGQPARLVVVSSDPTAVPRTEARFRDALPEFGVRFVPHAEADAFAAEVEATAH